MSKFALGVGTLVAATTLAIVSNTSAASFLQHQSLFKPMSLGSSGTGQPVGIKISVVGDLSTLLDLPVKYCSIWSKHGEEGYKDCHNEVLSNGKGYGVYLDNGSGEDLSHASYRIYIESANGKPVNHLCDLTLSGNDLAYSHSIAMVVSIVGRDKYSCKRYST